MYSIVFDLKSRRWLVCKETPEGALRVLANPQDYETAKAIAIGYTRSDPDFQSLTLPDRG
jgi:hypothetical protein